MAEISVASLAKRLGVSQRRANDLVADRAVIGRRTDSGAWLVDADSVNEYLRRRRTRRGLTNEAAWALLWLLDARTVDWVSESTLARLRRRIRERDADQLARDVAGRTRSHRYRAANAELAAEGLVLTGRSAASKLDTDLLDDRRLVRGYVPGGTAVSSWAAEHFMVEDETGQDILFDNTLPGGVDVEEEMPAAVVAAARG